MCVCVLVSPICECARILSSFVQVLCQKGTPELNVIPFFLPHLPRSPYLPPFSLPTISSTFPQVLRDPQTLKIAEHLVAVAWIISCDPFCASIAAEEGVLSWLHNVLTTCMRVDDRSQLRNLRVLSLLALWTLSEDPDNAVVIAKAGFAGLFEDLIMFPSDHPRTTVAAMGVMQCLMRHNSCADILANHFVR